MGVTIESKRFICDMGCSGFGRFRNIVAEKTNDTFYKHYMKLSEPEVMFMHGEERTKFFKDYNAKTMQYEHEGIISEEVANFLYQSDCGGKIDRKEASEIYKLIKDCDDGLSFGYTGRKDCATMRDMKKIFSDGTKVEWY